MIAATRALVVIPERRSQREEPVAVEEAPASRELVVVAPAAPKPDALCLSQRPAASFLAQLIATEKKFPQTLARNRAKPGEAIAAYGAVGRMVFCKAA